MHLLQIYEDLLIIESADSISRDGPTFSLSTYLAIFGVIQQQIFCREVWMAIQQT